MMFVPLSNGLLFVNAHVEQHWKDPQRLALPDLLWQDLEYQPW